MQMSRMGRLALSARTADLTLKGESCPAHSQQLSLPSAPVTVEVVSLVVRREGGVTGGGRQWQNGVTGGLRDFKKFRKVSTVLLCCEKN